MTGINDKAPEFELKDQNNNSVKLSDFKGKKVLIAFFPFAFSPVCSDELGCFESDMEEFSNKGAKGLGISVDSTWSNKAFAEKLGVNFPLLSDFSKEVSKAYGVLRKEGFSERAYFAIDGNGIITFKHVMGIPGKKLDNSKILEAI